MSRQRGYGLRQGDYGVVNRVAVDVVQPVVALIFDALAGNARQIAGTSDIDAIRQSFGAVRVPYPRFCL